MPCKVTRRFILQKARHHAFRANEALVWRFTARLAIRRWPPGPRPTSPRLTRHSALTVCKRSVSGSISLPSRGSFHLSLTVLVHYRLPKVFSLGKWASQIPTGLHVSRGTQAQQRESCDFRVRGFHPLWRAIPDPSTNHSFSPTLRAPCRKLCCGLQPSYCNGCNLSHSMSLGCSPFARHYSGNNLFSSPY